MQCKTENLVTLVILGSKILIQHQHVLRSCTAARCKLAAAALK